MCTFLEALRDRHEFHATQCGNFDCNLFLTLEIYFRVQQTQVITVTWKLSHYHIEELQRKSPSRHIASSELYVKRKIHTATLQNLGKAFPQQNYIWDQMFSKHKSIMIRCPQPFGHIVFLFSFSNIMTVIYVQKSCLWSHSQNISHLILISRHNVICHTQMS